MPLVSSGNCTLIFFQSARSTTAVTVSKTSRGRVRARGGRAGRVSRARPLRRHRHKDDDGGVFREAARMSDAQLLRCGRRVMLRYLE